MSAAPNFKPSEGKREEFRKYLEKTGVMDALTKVLVSLYEEPEKPEDALEYLRNKLASQAGCETTESLKAQLEEARTKIAELENENMTLKGTNQDEAADSGEPALEGAEGEQAEAAPAPEESEIAAEAPPPE